MTLFLYWQNREFSDIRNRHRRSRGTLLQLSDVRLGIVLRRSEQPVLGPRDAGRFNSVNCCRDSFHRVALATLEHAVLESSDAGVYTLEIHAFPTGRAARTFCRRQLRQSTSHGFVQLASGLPVGLSGHLARCYRIQSSQPH
jgi:hypothetical protein